MIHTCNLKLESEIKYKLCMLKRFIAMQRNKNLLWVSIYAKGPYKNSTTKNIIKFKTPVSIAVGTKLKGEPVS